MTGRAEHHQAGDLTAFDSFQFFDDCLVVLRDFVPRPHREAVTGQIDGRKL
jgi:hypothetical protein